MNLAHPLHLSVITVLILVAGCASPDKANIQLRKDNQQLRDQITQLKTQHDGDVATIEACQQNRPTAPSLPEQRLEKLFTTHGIILGQLTGGDDWDLSKSGDDGLKIYAVPTDDQNTPFKAAGSFKVQAFDLDDPAKPLIGTWNFDTNQTRDLFYSHALLYTYVLTCPWQTVPAHNDLTIKITFEDELTGRQFTAQKEAHINLPPATPATQSK